MKSKQVSASNFICFRISDTCPAQHGEKHQILRDDVSYRLASHCNDLQTFNGYLNASFPCLSFRDLSSIGYSFLAALSLVTKFQGWQCFEEQIYYTITHVFGMVYIRIYYSHRLYPTCAAGWNVFCCAPQHTTAHPKKKWIYSFSGVVYSTMHHPS